MSTEKEVQVPDAVRVSPPGWGWLTLLICSSVAVVLFLSGGLVSHLRLFKEQAEWEVERTERNEIQREWEKQHQQLQGQVDMANAEVEQLGKAKAAARGEAEAVQAELSQLVEKLTSARSQLDAVSSSREAALGDRDRARQDQVTAEKEVERSQAALQNLKADLARDTATEEQITESLTSLKEQETSLLAGIDAKSKQLDDLVQKLAALRQQSIDAQTQFEAESEKLHKATLELGKARQDMQSVQSKVAALRAEETTLTATNAALAITANSLREREKQLAAVEAELSEVYRERQKEEERLQKIRQDVEKNASNWLSTRAIHETRIAEVGRLKDEIQTLGGSRSSLESIVSDLQSAKGRLQEDVRELSEEVEGLSEQRAKLGVLEEVAAQLETEQQELRNEIREKKEELALLEESIARTGPIESKAVETEIEVGEKESR